MYAFHHHNGVVDHDGDGQNHGRKGEEVDGEPDDVEGEECTNQGHRNGDGGDERGAEVLEEEEHHEEHEYKGFDECLHHFMNRGEEEVVDVHDGANFQSRGECALHFVQLFLNALDNFRSIRAGNL